MHPNSSKYVFGQMSDEFCPDLAAVSGSYRYRRYCTSVKEQQPKEKCRIQNSKIGTIVYESTFSINDGGKEPSLAIAKSWMVQ